MDGVELERCKHCGGIARLIVEVENGWNRGTFEVVFHVECKVCAVRTAKYSTLYEVDVNTGDLHSIRDGRKAAIERWNGRPKDG